MNIEIKARCSDHDKIRKILKGKKAFFKGIDHQIDTYFVVKNGRLKLREGNIENSLIFYERSDKQGPKQSDVILYKSRDFKQLKKMLLKSIGSKVVVEKKREIYFVENVKIHVDEVKALGSFVEIEAIDKTGDIGKKKLHKQCNEFLDLFEIAQDQLITNSYSDMLLDKKIEIEDGSIDQVVELSKKIPEFEQPYEKYEYDQRLRFTKHKILVAKFNGKPVGFKVGYQQEDHFYSWMGAVLPGFRQLKIAKKLAEKQEEFCRKNYFKKIRMKTRNKHKIMLSFAIRSGFEIVDIIPKQDSKETRIILEKIL
ncbi:MAG: GNAT family N-acetyltransferase [Candidatus Cloacimonetes bacterium]|nr:GNAT family N-acetyltransferase [Candidatus Cloacimonadota bacterium]MCF7883492.1 GNAT family N-acetyltransferase [Candidatus Cloacimonadota bacterium]